MMELQMVNFVDVGAPFRLILFVRYRVYTTKSFIFWQEDFEDTNGVIRIRKSKDKQHNGQKDKERSTKYYT
jgi:hypothetical protein